MEFAKTIRDLLEEACKRGASDLHLTVGVPPVLRIDGQLHHTEEPILDNENIKGLVYSAMMERQIKTFEEKHELDFAMSWPKIGRFRVNVFQQRGSVAAVLRTIPHTIMTIEEIGINPVIKEVALKPRGLVLFTGPTGSGKSTTLAAIINYINQNRRCHIITIEDPIEYLFRHDKAIVNQREVGEDTLGFGPALKHVLRQDPDVIVVGELRDLETMETGLTAAETGHLVLGTLHTNDATQAVDRIVDAFPANKQEQIRIQMGATLEAVMSQTLCRRVGSGRILAYELMLGTNAVKSLVREGKTHQLSSIIQTSQKIGMQTLDAHLLKLVEKGLVTFDEGYSKAIHPETFKRSEFSIGAAR
ncbi:MAG: type IV pili twitching motility protein PilT [Candidatus Riflebacteria bacterium RBG_13_59_9]|nr:MAG: type IV pili twitching motility protein PilT [Candidatus Riflebacteria bacterium RBG_13_59_9]